MLLALWVRKSASIGEPNGIRTYRLREPKMRDMIAQGFITSFLASFECSQLSSDHLHLLKVPKFYGFSLNVWIYLLKKPRVVLGSKYWPVIFESWSIVSDDVCLWNCNLEVIKVLQVPVSRALANRTFEKLFSSPAQWNEQDLGPSILLSD